MKRAAGLVIACVLSAAAHASPGFDDVRAIGKDETAFHRMERLAQHHEKETRNKLERRPHADDLYRVAHDIRRRVDRAGHGAVRLARAHHQVREAERIEHGGARLIGRHAFLLAQREEFLCKAFGM